MSFQGDSWQVFDDIGRRKYLTDAERERFLRCAAELDEGPRLLCATLALAGCRISEALAVQPHHLDLERATITFRTLKRRKLVFRAVPVPVELVRELAELPCDPESGKLWPMHRATAWRLVKRLMVDAAIAGPMASCKGLRHAYGMRAAACAVPSNIVRKLMGHATTSTTEAYVDAVGWEERLFASRMWAPPGQRA